jgi:hypothetical protein
MRRDGMHTDADGLGLLAFPRLESMLFPIPFISLVAYVDVGASLNASSTCARNPRTIPYPLA